MNNIEETKHTQFLNFHSQFVGGSFDSIKEIPNICFSGKALLDYVETYKMATCAKNAQVESEEIKLPNTSEFLYSNWKPGMIHHEYVDLIDSLIEYHRKEWEKEKIQLLENIMESFIGLHSDYHAEIVETVIQDLKNAI